MYRQLGRIFVGCAKRGRNLREKWVDRAPNRDQFPNVSGWNHQVVLDLLRAARRETPWSSEVRLGLIIEGGAMRGVVSCAYALALSEFIDVNRFAFVCGASAGGLNGVYFAARSLPLALKIYSENATDKRCTNIWRFPNVLDADWLVDTWMFGARQFDISTLQAAVPDVRLVLTNLEDGTPSYFDAKGASLAELRKAMKATAYAPLLTERRQLIEGVPYGDGAIADTFPYQYLTANGATHIICLATRPELYRKQIGPVEALAHRLRLLSHTNKYLATYFARPKKYNESLDLMYNGGVGAVPTLVIRPATDQELPTPVANNATVVARLAEAAIGNARNQLGAAVR